MNGVTTNYIYDGDLLVAEYTDTKTIVYIYDAFGSPTGFKCRTSTYDEDVWDMYYYEKNLQGDIVAIYNTSGTKLVSYTYNVWGVTTKSYSNGGASTTATYNNLTYRGYYYDSNLSMYYLQSRYYDPVVCRFISPDAIGYLGANEDLTSYNLYAYCSNNPINNVDPTGNFAISALILGVLIGSAVGGALSTFETVYQDYKDDGAIFNGSVGIDEYTGNILGGLVSGAGIGVCTTLGAGLGAAMIAGETLTIGTITLSGASALTIGLSSSFISGASGYLIRTSISEAEIFQTSDMIAEAGANTISGMLSFAGGFAGGATGVNVPGETATLNNFLKYHLGLTYFGVYPTKYFVSKIKSRIQEGV